MRKPPSMKRPRPAPIRRLRPRIEALENRAMLASGDLDTSFGGGDGIVGPYPVAGVTSARAIALRPDGRIIAAGRPYVNTPTPSGTAENIVFGLTGYTADGTLDTAFGTGGHVTTKFQGYTKQDSVAKSDYLSDVLVQPDGKIVAVGFATIKHGTKKFDRVDEDFALARYHANGNLDSTFGTGGKVTTDFGGGGESIRAIAMQNGKLIVGGSALGGFTVARYNVNGTLDTSFDGDGKATTIVNSGGGILKLLIQPEDGKIVAVGSNTADGVVAVVRYLPDGALDSSFGVGGIVTTSVSPTDFAAYEATLQPDGRIVVAGHFVDPLDPWDLNSFLVRYDSNGTLDVSFGVGGIALHNLDSGDDSIQGGIHVQADGRIIAAGVLGGGEAEVPVTYDDFFLARFLPDGSLDTSFQTGGLIVTPVNTQSDFAWDMVVQPDGKVLVAGSALLRHMGDASLVATATGPGAPANVALSDPALASIRGEAIARWTAIGADPRSLAGVQFNIASLPGNLLGQASGNTITLDRDAAGWGWFVDPTPRTDFEFRLPGNQGEQRRIDLLTAVMHELGHVLGLEHDQGAEDVMFESLDTGDRHVPGQADWMDILALAIDEQWKRERKRRG